MGALVVLAMLVAGSRRTAIRRRFTPPSSLHDPTGRNHTA